MKSNREIIIIKLFKITCEKSCLSKFPKSPNVFCSELEASLSLSKPLNFFPAGHKSEMMTHYFLFIADNCVWGVQRLVSFYRLWLYSFTPVEGIYSLLTWWWVRNLKRQFFTFLRSLIRFYFLLNCEHIIKRTSHNLPVKSSELWTSCVAFLFLKFLYLLQ